MTGYGLISPSLWKFLKGLARSTLMITKIFTMSTKRQPSSSDSLAWDQKHVSALTGMMGVGALAQNNFRQLDDYLQASIFWEYLQLQDEVINL